jgi:hypothetical protein
MERRSFIALLPGVLTAIGLSSSACETSKKKERSNAPSHPFTLLDLMDEQALIRAGTDYRKKFPGEDHSGHLREIIVADLGLDQSEYHPSDISRLVESTVMQDFKNERTVLVDGWVLSVTEARQCALFSMQ